MLLLSVRFPLNRTASTFRRETGPDGLSSAGSPPPAGTPEARERLANHRGRRPGKPAGRASPRPSRPGRGPALTVRQSTCCRSFTSSSIRILGPRRSHPCGRRRGRHVAGRGRAIAFVANHSSGRGARGTSCWAIASAAVSERRDRRRHARAWVSFGRLRIAHRLGR